jgi:hypothetical protein
MKWQARLTLIIQVLNSLGFVAYLVWLATSHERILYSRQGVFYLLPCVAFIFVFAYLRHGPHATDDDEAPEQR